tara:strand:+ start:1539 stop:1868 length:330 start_codon:yes stop_codon:yes gene_type:complete
MERQGQSKLGIASLLISIFTAIGIFITIIIAGIVEANTIGGMDEESLEAILLGLSIFGLCFLDLLSIGLGIAGIFQKIRYRITAIIGTIISTATLIITLSLIVIGLAIG